MVIVRQTEPITNQHYYRRHWTIELNRLFDIYLMLFVIISIVSIAIQPVQTLPSDEVSLE